MILGVDISSYQGNPNFDAIKADGKDFVVIKLTQGTNYVNPAAARDRAEAHRVGMGVGLYHFAGGGDADDEARYFVNNCGEIETGEVIALDFEINISDTVAWCKMFLDECLALTGIKPLIYLNQSLVKNNDWSSVIAGDYGLWLAQYDGLPNGTIEVPWSTVAIKQYSSSGAVSGIAGNVDLDSFFSDLPTFYKYGKQGNEPMAAATKQDAESLYRGYLGRTAAPDYEWAGQDLEVAFNGIRTSPEAQNYAATILTTPDPWSQVAGLTTQIQSQQAQIETLNAELLTNQQVPPVITPPIIANPPVTGLSLWQKIIKFLRS